MHCSINLFCIWFVERDDVDSSDDFDFWGSNYRYLIIPVIIVLAVLFVAVMLFIKWKYYPSTVLYCKGMYMYICSTGYVGLCDDL